MASRNVSRRARRITIVTPHVDVHATRRRRCNAAAVRATTAAIASVAVAIALTGCAGQGRTCSAVGAGPPGIDIWYGDVVRAHPHQRLTAQACVLGSCTTHALTRRYKENMIAGGDVVKDGTPVVVRLRITDATGRTVFSGRNKVSPRKDQPNGPGCGPITWGAVVKATGQHALTATTA